MAKDWQCSDNNNYISNTKGTLESDVITNFIEIVL